jgi:hypothetical protein
MKRLLQADFLQQRMLEKICLENQASWTVICQEILQAIWTSFEIPFAVNIADVGWINLLWLIYTFIYETEILNKTWSN